MRLDGATFLAHLPAVADAMARSFARGLANAVAASGVDIGTSESLRVSCSIGVAGLPFVADNPSLAGWELAYAVAGGALRLARRAGAGSVLALLPSGALPEGFARAVSTDPQPLVDAGVPRAVSEP